MRTTDLFTFNRSAKRLNESLAKTFGRKLNLETFSVEQLEDARNKLRTQIYTARSSSNFNETVENDTLSKAQFMHDAIVAELSERDEPIVDNTVYEGPDIDKQSVLDVLRRFDENMNERGGYGDPDPAKILAALSQGDVESAVEEVWNSYSDQDGGEIDMDDYIEDLEYTFKDMVGGSDDEGGDTDDGYALASAGHGSDEDYGSFNQGEGYDMDQVRADAAAGVKKSIDKQSDDRMAKLKSDKNKGFMAKVGDKIIGGAKGAAKGFMGKESIEQTGDNMSNLREGEIQQASAIVTAKTMVDRVGRWIEELSGMENDTLLQLGDSIRDEMGQEQAKQFISTVAPAIQSALENLKQARETLSGGVRTLTGEEQPAEMLGGDPAADMAAPAEPDAMNAEPGVEPAGDDFDAAEPAAGGIGDAGREQRESIDRQSRLLKVLAG
jgi:hypothetical protein